MYHNYDGQYAKSSSNRDPGTVNEQVINATPIVPEPLWDNLMPH